MTLTEQITAELTKQEHKVADIQFGTIVLHIERGELIRAEITESVKVTN